VTAPLPEVYLARHGETAWSISGQHTGRTDLPLTQRGERQARALGERLRRYAVTAVLTSPSQRAVRTSQIAGFGELAEINSSAHILRILTARWLGLEPAGGRYWLLGTASVGVLGYEHNLTEPVIRLWNETHHIEVMSGD